MDAPCHHIDVDVDTLGGGLWLHTDGSCLVWIAVTTSSWHGSLDGSWIGQGTMGGNMNDGVGEWRLRWCKKVPIGVSSPDSSLQRWRWNRVTVDRTPVVDLG